VAVSATPGAGQVRAARTIPLHRSIPRLARDPVGALAEFGREADGDIVRLGLGLFRPYLLTRPEHVQHVLRDHPDRYVRDGMMWKPMRRLNGEGIASDGPTWESSRRLMQPLFAAKNVNALLDRMSAVIVAAVDQLDSEGPIDLATELTRVVHRALISAFFADGISGQDADRLGRDIVTAFTSLGARMLLPFVPHAIPLPGDRAFRRAVRSMDEAIFPLIRARRRAGADGDDIVSLLCQARDEDGKGLTDRQVRDDVVALFVAGTETTALALTWLWVVLDTHPAVADKLYAEITEVVGAAQPAREHLTGLRYTKQVLQEVERLYPAGWVIPRTVAVDDVIDGVPIKAGSTVLLSPYLTHRLPEHWDQPEEFRPERFAPGQADDRHRFAYFPFGGGGHVCLGSHFFTVEAQLILAAMIARYRPELVPGEPVRAQAAASLRPGRRIDVILRPAPLADSAS
jgi:cytochrome P450